MGLSNVHTGIKVAMNQFNDIESVKLVLWCLDNGRSIGHKVMQGRKNIENVCFSPYRINSNYRYSDGDQHKNCLKVNFVYWILTPPLPPLLPPSASTIPPDGICPKSFGTINRSEMKHSVLVLHNCNSMFFFSSPQSVCMWVSMYMCLINCKCYLD